MGYLQAAKLAAVLCALLAVFLGYRFVQSRVDDYINTKKELAAQVIATAEAQAKAGYLEQSRRDAEQFADTRAAITSKAQSEIDAARAEAQAGKLSTDQLERISQTPRGNEALTYRAKQRTAELFDALETESDWTPIYENQ